MKQYDRGFSDDEILVSVCKRSTKFSLIIDYSTIMILFLS